MVVWKHPVVLFLARPIPLSHWNGHIATVVSVDFGLVVRISEDACPSVHYIIQISNRNTARTY